jgi:putative transposase
MTPESSLYHRHRFPSEIISHAVWQYHVFSLSPRDVALILAERGVTVTHESVRNWCRKFGAAFAQRLRRRRPRPGDTWHLDEVFIRIRGVLHYLWRAVDQHEVVPDILVQEKRDGAAAKRFFKCLLKGLHYEPRRLITDGLRSYGVARCALLPEVRHLTSRYLNNRAENSHRATRRCERQMQRFKSLGQAQDFLSAHAIIYGHFRPRRHRLLMCAAAGARNRVRAPTPTIAAIHPSAAAPEAGTERAGVTNCIRCGQQAFSLAVRDVPSASPSQAAKPAPVPTSAVSRPSMSSVGKVNWKVTPCPAFAEARNRPPCASMIDRLIDNPTPIPSALVV